MKSKKQLQQEKTNTNILIAWIVCGLVFFLGLVSRRVFLLEFTILTTAFLGFVTLGVCLYRRYAPFNKKDPNG